MYESPINIFETPMEISSEFNKQTEEMVYNAVKNVGVVVDKDELIKALVYDRYQYNKGWRDCQEMVEEKCRKLGIDYIAIFTEQESN